MNSNLPKVLVLDDDQTWLDQVPLILEDECIVDGFSTVEQGLKAIETFSYDIILLDLNFDNDHRSGLEIFRQIHALDSGADIIVISGETKPTKMVEIFNAGASKYIAKPAQPDEIRAKVRETLNQRTIRFRAINLGTINGEDYIGNSQAVLKLRADINRVVSAGARDVLLLGESGSGKEVVAKMIAKQADRSGARLVAVQCGALSENIVESELFGHVKGSFTGAEAQKIGHFEAARGGFVFLDEIGEMPMSQQPKLLRVLQERKVQRVGSIEEIPVSFKCISATNVDLNRAITEKKFRLDLYYRISRHVIQVPSLRERLDDLPELAYSIIGKLPEHRGKTLTQEAIHLLQSYDWPGNFRELDQKIVKMCTECEGNVIREKDVCEALPAVAKLTSSRITKVLVGKYGASLIAGERKRFERALIDANGDRRQAAKLLGFSRATFFRKAKDLGLIRERHRQQAY